MPNNTIDNHLHVSSYAMTTMQHAGNGKVPPSLSAAHNINLPSLMSPKNQPSISPQAKREFIKRMNNILKTNLGDNNNEDALTASSSDDESYSLSGSIIYTIEREVNDQARQILQLITSKQPQQADRSDDAKIQKRLEDDFNIKLAKQYTKQQLTDAIQQIITDYEQSNNVYNSKAQSDMNELKRHMQTQTQGIEEQIKHWKQELKTLKKKLFNAQHNYSMVSATPDQVTSLEEKIVQLHEKIVTTKKAISELQKQKSALLFSSLQETAKRMMQNEDGDRQFSHSTSEVKLCLRTFAPSIGRGLEKAGLVKIFLLGAYYRRLGAKGATSAGAITDGGTSSSNNHSHTVLCTGVVRKSKVPKSNELHLAYLHILAMLEAHIPENERTDLELLYKDESKSFDVEEIKKKIKDRISALQLDSDKKIYLIDTRFIYGNPLLRLLIDQPKMFKDHKHLLQRAIKELNSNNNTIEGQAPKSTQLELIQFNCTAIWGHSDDGLNRNSVQTFLDLVEKKALSEAEKDPTFVAMQAFLKANQNKSFSGAMAFKVHFAINYLSSYLPQNQFYNSEGCMSAKDRATLFKIFNEICYNHASYLRSKAQDVSQDEKYVPTTHKNQDFFTLLFTNQTYLEMALEVFKQSINHLPFFNTGKFGNKNAAHLLWLLEILFGGNKIAVSAAKQRLEGQSGLVKA